MRKRRSVSGPLDSGLEELQAEITRFRLDSRAKRLPGELRNKVVNLIIDGNCIQAEVCRALGIASPTVSRWVAEAGDKRQRCRELTLVPHRLPIAQTEPALPLERAILRLPNGLQVDLPVAAVTAALVTELLAVSGVAV